MHVPALPIPAPHARSPHRPVPLLTGRRPPPATVALTTLYTAAVAVALTAPAEHAPAGCLVLAGVTARWAVHRRRSAAGAVATVTAAVDTVLPADGGPGEVPAAAPAAAA
jgi:hypothetical protein